MNSLKFSFDECGGHADQRFCLILHAHKNCFSFFFVDVLRERKFIHVGWHLLVKIHYSGLSHTLTLPASQLCVLFCYYFRRSCSLVCIHVYHKEGNHKNYNAALVLYIASRIVSIGSHNSCMYIVHTSHASMLAHKAVIWIINCSANSSKSSLTSCSAAYFFAFHFLWSETMRMSYF